MVDLTALNARVSASGIKRTAISNEMGISAPTLRRKLRGQTPLTANDIDALGSILNLSSADIRRIFFAKSVN